MSKQKSNKAVLFIKRNIYYIIMAVCIVAIIAMVTLALVLTLPNSSVDNIDDGYTVTDTPPQSENGDKGSQTPVDVIVPQDVVNPMAMMTPVANATIIKDYSMTLPVFNQTLNKYKVHNGIDFGAEAGTLVVSARDGVVESVTYDKLNGHKVVIRHSDTICTEYSSIDNVNVKEGEKVEGGYKIGEVSTSAGAEFSDGAHLHFCITENGEYVDPNNYLGGNK